MEADDNEADVYHYNLTEVWLDGWRPRVKDKLGSHPIAYQYLSLDE